MTSTIVDRDALAQEAIELRVRYLTTCDLTAHREYVDLVHAHELDERLIDAAVSGTIGARLGIAIREAARAVNHNVSYFSVREKAEYYRSVLVRIAEAAL